jgi:hypothetical protein
MNFLRQLANIFTPRPSPASGDVGLYYYIRCNRCGEVIKVRVNPMNDLSISDEPGKRFTHKTIVGQRCYNRIEADFTYDNNRKLVNSEISGGTMVTQEDYENDQNSSPKK